MLTAAPPYYLPQVIYYKYDTDCVTVIVILTTLLLYGPMLFKLLTRAPPTPFDPLLIGYNCKLGTAVRAKGQIAASLHW